MHSILGLVVLVTTSGEEEAQRLAQLLLEQRVIACANVIPRVSSLFHWQDRLEAAEESLMVIKTTSEALGAVISTVRQHHSYEVPEIIALPIVAGSDAYLAWLAREVQPRAASCEE
jgi:uncharacterized protein involved in tolerance to divalent cations